MRSHAEKSSALCSLAAEVQMVCLYASLTQCRSFTSALLCLLLLDSVHHSSTPVTLLCFALSTSLCRIFQLCHACFFVVGWGWGMVSVLPQEHSLKVFPQCQKSHPPINKDQDRICMLISHCYFYKILVGLKSVDWKLTFHNDHTLQRS